MGTSYNHITDPISDPISDLAADHRPIDVVVIGGGLAGLTAAATAAGDGRRVVLLDTRSVGGRARTDEHHGFFFNQGAHALYRGGAARAVFERMGMVITGGPPATDRAGALRGNELFALPTNTRSLVSSGLLGVRSKAQVGALLARIGHVDPTALAGLSINGWLDSLGLRPDGRALVETITRVATYAADFDACSADAGVAQLQSAVLHGVDYLDDGWRQLVDGLVGVARARGVEIMTDERALAVTRDSGGAGWNVVTAGGELSATAVVVAPGSPAATAALLPDEPAWDLGVDTTAACLDLGLRRAPRPPVVFAVDRPLYLSTHCPPARLAPEGQVVVQLMRYGARTAAADRAELWELAGVAGIAEADVVTDRFLHRMTVAHSLPKPGRGLAGRPAVDSTGHPGLFVAGDWVGPVGMLADASVASGEAAGRSARVALERSAARA